jgi:hypothetical protein
MRAVRPGFSHNFLKIPSGTTGGETLVANSLSRCATPHAIFAMHVRRLEPSTNRPSYQPNNQLNAHSCSLHADAIRANLDENQFIKFGVVSGLRQLLEFGLFHGDPHAVRFGGFGLG